MSATTPPVTVAIATPSPGLGIGGRVLVVLLVVGGLLVASLALPLGLIWFAAYGGVGTILAIKRPRTSIGWLLLALGWAHVVASLPPDAGGPDLASLVASLPDATWPLVFALYATLCLVLPSGDLPSGRRGTLARVLLVLAGACVVLNVAVPALADVVVLAMIGVLVVSVGLLVERTLRAQGVERQQLRWIASSLALVVAGFVLSVVIGIVVPGSGESGLAWLPVACAFPTVPLAIGIAVMRYRLYQIDTVINRAIVYGLLTAVLAGASAAAISIAQRLFQGYVGSGSDVSVVLTTLVVVSTFNPVKASLQSLVDRRFKEALRPADALDRFVADVRHAISVPDADRTLRRFLDVAAAAFGASGGELRIGRDERPQAFTTGTVGTATPTLTAAASGHGSQVDVQLWCDSYAGPPQILQAALVSVLHEIGTHPQEV